MFTIKEILDATKGRLFSGDIETEITGVSIDSRTIKTGDLFIAIKGSRFDGHNFINEALSRGASALVINADCGLRIAELSPFRIPHSEFCIPIIEVPDTIIALAQICDNFYEHPSGKLHIIGITGTNGKTTTSHIISSILKAEGYSAGMLGTINYIIGNRLIPATNTTPGALEVQSYLSQMVRLNMRFCVMEVSSHSLCQHRVDCVNFKVAVFTNLGSDHLDYHKTREDYFLAKLKLFKELSQNDYAIINIDDPCARRIIEFIKTNNRANILTYGYSAGADIFATDLTLSPQGIKFMLQSPKGNIEIHSNLLGRHNIYNILASAGATLCLGMALETVRTGIETLQMVRGRLETVQNPYHFKIFIDYAHTPEALRCVLSVLKELGLYIILVFGCGGDRDKTKRPLMGKIAAEYANFVYVTTDNPRSEDPHNIISEIEEGLKEMDFKDYELIIDRQDAIKEALRRAVSLDNEKVCLLIAGKGHETYQILKDSVVPFDDRDIVKKALTTQMALAYKGA